MDHEMDKRKASPNALDAVDIPDPKKIQVTEELELELESVVEDDSDMKDFLLKMPHQFGNHTVLEYLFKETYVDFMARKVIKHSQLKSLIDDLMAFLRKASDDGVYCPGDFARKVNELFDHQEFIQACVDTHFTEEEDCHFITVCIQCYKDEKQPKERMESLMGDHFLVNHVLKQTECLPITRGVLSVLIGYWSNDAFYGKLQTCARNFILQRDREEEPSTTATFLRDETVVGIDFPANIEGLKEALRSRYPADEAEFMCEKIDKEKEDFKDRFRNVKEEHHIKGFVIMLVGNSFSMPYISFSDDDWLLGNKRYKR